jgi:hypothetical protein
MEAPMPPEDERERAIQRQYRAARAFPGEVVVLVGSRVVYHGTDREEAVRRYEAVADQLDEGTPAFIEPDEAIPQRDPIVRARSSREGGG